MVAKRTNSTNSPKRPASAKDAAATSAKSTASGPSVKPDSGVVDAATAKMAGAEKLAGAMPFNAGKPSEFGEAAREPATGQAVAPPHPMVGGSTLTETNASPKVGKGNPPVSFNPGNGSLDRVRVDSSERVLDHQPGRPDLRQSELPQGGAARSGSARGFRAAGEDHPFRP